MALRSKGRQAPTRPALRPRARLKSASSPCRRGRAPRHRPGLPRPSRPRGARAACQRCRRPLGGARRGRVPPHTGLEQLALLSERSPHPHGFNHFGSPNASPRRSRDCRASLLQSPTFWLPNGILGVSKSCGHSGPPRWLATTSLFWISVMFGSTFAAWRSQFAFTAAAPASRVLATSGIDVAYVDSRTGAGHLPDLRARDSGAFVPTVMGVHPWEDDAVDDGNALNSGRSPAENGDAFRGVQPPCEIAGGSDDFISCCPCASRSAARMRRHARFLAPFMKPLATRLAQIWIRVGAPKGAAHARRERHCCRGR